METERNEEGHDDQRATEPPAEDSAAEADSAGPQGNPEVDEEALQHGQQEAADD
jgi:hypothetical protein